MHYRSARDQLAALRAGTVTSQVLVEAAIARITRLDGQLNAVVISDFDRARQAAIAADAVRARGGDGALLGLPVTVKEAFNVTGLPTTWGLPGTQHLSVTEDAVLVARLRSAGAVILGKTNVSTLLADWQADNPVYGTTNNPWDRARTPGGSSGGGAAALAAGFVALEFGSDLGGSLRIPASFCGVFSHRPSYGIVPMRGFAPPGAPTLVPNPPVDQAVVGPMARSAADLQLALDVIAGPDDADAVGYEVHLPPPRRRTLSDFRVLIIDETPLMPTAASVRSAFAEIGDRLVNAGCKVAWQSSLLPDLTASGRSFIELLMAYFAADMPEGDYNALAQQVAGIPRDTRDLQALSQRALAMSHRDWIIADRERFTLAHQWRQLFAQWDVVLCPAVSVTAGLHDQTPFETRSISIDGQDVPYGMLPGWAGWPTPSGQPVTTMPIGQDAVGLPIGMQIIGPRLEDRTTIAFAGLVEEAFGGFVVPPDYADERAP